MQAFQDPLSVFTAQAAATSTANKPKFVEGTAYQLARALYDVHTSHEASPAAAVQETQQRMIDNVDRKTLLLAARSEAEALARKRMIIIHSGKPQQQQRTVFEQVQLMAKKDLAKLKVEIRALRNKNETEKAAPSTPVKVAASAKITRSMREKLVQAIALERQIETAEYTAEQIKEAAARLKRIEDMENPSDKSGHRPPDVEHLETTCSSPTPPEIGPKS